MRILLSNDDGLHAPGLAAAERALSAIGEVHTVAPDRERSATGHAITLHAPLRITRIGPRRHIVNGTPTDCVYMALNHIIEGEAPALVVSGINHGANLGNDLTYSGTVGAAMEGCCMGVASIAGSSLGQGPDDLEAAAGFVATVAAEVAERGLPAGVLLNVNVPAGWRPGDGWSLTQIGVRNYGNHVQVRRDPRGGEYFWIGGPPPEHDDIPGSDCNAVLDGRASITPVKMDLTDHASLAAMAAWSVGGRGPA